MRSFTYEGRVFSNSKPINPENPWSNKFNRGTFVHLWCKIKYNVHISIHLKLTLLEFPKSTQ